MNGRLAAAVAYALTGETFEWAGSADGTDSADETDVVRRLAEAGWTPQRVVAHAREAVEAGLAWPHTVSPQVVGELGAARFLAALGEAREALGVWSLDVEPPSRRRALNADERRLLAEAPPHHVG